MQPNDLDLKAVHPSRGARYSPNLYHFLARRAHPIQRRYARVYRDSLGAMWLGYFDDGQLMGARLNHVLTHGATSTVLARADTGPLTEVPDFWARYQAVGRCAIDPEHRQRFVGDGSRWIAGRRGQACACAWCGPAQGSEMTSVEREGTGATV